MGIKAYKPTTNGRRNMTSLDFAEITTSTPEKSLLVSLKNKAGRNNNGRITVRHQGGGHKRHYRLIDFKRNKDGVEAVVKTIEYDPNRTANIALVHYTDGVKAYILAPKGLEVGQRIVSGPDADIKVGNALPLANIPVGTVATLTFGRLRAESAANSLPSSRITSTFESTLSAESTFANSAVFGAANERLSTATNLSSATFAE